METTARMWPPVRLVVMAAAVAVGIVGSAMTGPGAEAAGVWACAVGAAALGMRGRARWVVVAALVGATLAARERAREPSLPPGVVADDREEDTLRGIVVGPIAEGDRERFVLEVEGVADARVVVTAVAPVVLPGDRIEVTGRVRVPRGFRNPGGVDRAAIVRGRGADLEMFAGDVRVVERGAVVTPWRWAARAHRAATRRIAARGGDPAGNAIVRGAVIGDRSAVPEETDAAWRAAGIYHALSVSGLHLAVVAMLLYGAVRRAWAAIPPLAMRIDAARAAAACAAPAAIAYTFVTGGQTATLRALVVVLAILAGVALRRRLVVLDAVGLAALAILLHRPSAIADPSFQLSFTAAITLCVIARGAGWIRRTVSASIWVTATTAPITAWHFHEVAIGGVAGNLVLAPVVELLVIPAGLAGLALGALGGPLVDLAIAAAGLVDAAARAFARVVPVLEVAPPRLPELAGWFAAIAGVRLGLRTRRGAALALAGVVVAGASLAWPRGSADLRVTFLDVGQGDAAVVELPGGEVWLIDAGGLPGGAPDATPAQAARRQRAPGEAIRRFLATRRIDRLDVVVISHPHPDHYLGLAALAGRVEIGEVWIARPPPGEAPPAAGDQPTQADVLAALGAPVVHPPLGVARTAGGATLEVLAPVYDDGTGPLAVAAADPVRSVNDDSLVVAVGFAGRRVLFLGDIEREGEDRLVAAGLAAADVVKVAHHGSATSSTAELVAATGARRAIISCGRSNRFGFPAPEVVARWTGAGAEVLRTDRSGAITVTITPAGSISLATFD